MKHPESSNSRKQGLMGPGEGTVSRSQKDLEPWKRVHHTGVLAIGMLGHCQGHSNQGWCSGWGGGAYYLNTPLL